MKCALRRIAILVFVAFGNPAVVRAQHYFEARIADPEYRYLDWNYTFASSAIVDLFYVGVPGSDEIDLGAGYVFKPTASLMVAPLVYAVYAHQGEQRGVKIAVLASFERNGWKASAFLGHFERVSGDVGSYQVLDTLDATRSVGAHLELGVSTGFFHAEHEWNGLAGPLAKWNDRHGFWGVSCRFGHENELRAVRVFLLAKPPPHASS